MTKNKHDIRGTAVFLIALVLILFPYFYRDKRPENHPRNNPSSSTNGSVEFPRYKVVPGSIYDGDTIRVVPASINGFSKSQQLKIRFACIDAPERNQPGGIEAREELKRILERGGNQVQLNIISTDRYGRSVAEVWNSDGLVQSQLVQLGLVYPYEQYSSDCPSWDIVKSGERYAKANRLGVWANPNAVKPWEYRKKN